MKGKIMRTPKHIKEAILKLKEISVETHIECAEKEVDDILKDLEKVLTFYDKVEIIKRMIELASYLERVTGIIILNNWLRRQNLQWISGAKKSMKISKLLMYLK